jgi:hypothetical protein
MCGYLVRRFLQRLYTAHPRSRNHNFTYNATTNISAFEKLIKDLIELVKSYYRTENVLPNADVVLGEVIKNSTIQTGTCSRLN